MVKEKDVRIAEKFTGELNCFGFDYKGVCEAMLREHRTLQQNFTRLCVEWFLTLANAEEWNFDGRNEASRELAKKLQNELEDAALPFI